jgi:hypothetical protein
MTKGGLILRNVAMLGSREQDRTRRNSNLRAGAYPYISSLSSLSTLARLRILYTRLCTSRFQKDFFNAI